MRQRSAIGRAKRGGNADAERAARREVHELKVALGERGPVWWEDGAPDYNRYLAKNTPYGPWYEALESAEEDLSHPRPSSWSTEAFCRPWKK